MVEKKHYVLACYILSICLAWNLFVNVAYNYETKFWYDKPYLDSDYYTFHPHIDDSCETLQSKFDLFHPNGTNPIRFEILKEMFANDCEIILDD